MPVRNEFSTALLRVFVHVARLGSFTAVGPVLGYTQSAISRQIAALEDEAGMQLFDRLPRGVRLTEPGRRLLGHAEAVLGQLDAARRELSDLRDLTIGRLRIGAFSTADAVLVPRAVAAFLAAHPGLEVVLREGVTPDLLTQLADGEADVAVVSFPSARRIDGFDLHELCEDQMYVALPRDHRLAAAPTLRLADLSDENWIAGSTRPEDTLISSCLRTGFRPRIGFIARDWIAKQGFVAAGVGITMIPALIADTVRSDIALSALHPDDVSPRLVYAATPSGLTTSPSTHAFLRILRDHRPRRTR
ncbi:LysR family transcriptional regulator [Actinokineospora sp.]|uniref:LysR family transcriptional regulator n=1 Tax=Actinokineospora sp. TaxID=1872133 RepID=UPI00403838FF